MKERKMNWMLIRQVLVFVFQNATILAAFGEWLKVGGDNGTLSAELMHTIDALKEKEAA